jgi:hypothetical protein
MAGWTVMSTPFLRPLDQLVPNHRTAAWFRYRHRQAVHQLPVFHVNCRHNTTKKQPYLHTSTTAWCTPSLVWLTELELQQQYL